MSIDTKLEIYTYLIVCVYNVGGGVCLRNSRERTVHEELLKIYSIKCSLMPQSRRCPGSTDRTRTAGCDREVRSKEVEVQLG